MPLGQLSHTIPFLITYMETCPRVFLSEMAGGLFRGQDSKLYVTRVETDITVVRAGTVLIVITCILLVIPIA